METLNIEKFNPTKAELSNLVKKYKALEIKGVGDTAGYIAVDSARKELKKVRVQIEKDGKFFRSEAIAFQKAIIEKEKELVGIIEPLEIELTTKQKAVDDAKVRAEREKALPERLAKLQEIGLTPANEIILDMDDLRFSEFFNQAKSDYLIEKERKQKEEKEASELKLKQEQEDAQRKIKEEQEAAAAKMDEERKKLEEEKAQIEREKLAIEKEKQRIIDEEKAKKEAEERAKREAEEKVIRDKEEAELKVKREAEEKAKAEAARIELEKKQKLELEKQAAYQEFLTTHGYKDDGSFMTHQEFDGGKITLYKKLGEFKF